MKHPDCEKCKWPHHPKAFCRDDCRVCGKPVYNHSKVNCRLKGVAFSIAAAFRRNRDHT